MSLLKFEELNIEFNLNQLCCFHIWRETENIYDISLCFINGIWTNSIRIDKDILFNTIDKLISKGEFYFLDTYKNEFIYNLIVKNKIIYHDITNKKIFVTIEDVFNYRDIIKINKNDYKHIINKKMNNMD